jgi:hypothetical protein
MKFQFNKNCLVCGKSVGGRKGHPECSKIIQTNFADKQLKKTRIRKRMGKSSEYATKYINYIDRNAL